MLPTDPRLDRIDPLTWTLMAKHQQHSSIEFENRLDHIINVATARLSPEVWSQNHSQIIADTEDRIKRRWAIYDTGADPHEDFLAGSGQYAELEDEVRREYNEMVANIRAAESTINVTDNITEKLE